MAATMSDYGRRGGNSRAHKYVIDGRYYTVAQIARELGMSPNGTVKRLKTRRHTWTALKSPTT